MISRSTRLPTSLLRTAANRTSTSSFRPDNSIRKHHITVPVRPNIVKTEGICSTQSHTGYAFTASIAKTKEAAADEMAIARATSFCVFVDGSVRDGCIGAAAVHVREDGVSWTILAHVKKRQEREHTAFEAELLALNKGLDLVAWLLPPGQTRVTILSDCVQAIDGLSVPLNKNSHP